MVREEDMNYWFIATVMLLVISSVLISRADETENVNKGAVVHISTSIKTHIIKCEHWNENNQCDEWGVYKQIKE